LPPLASDMAHQSGNIARHFLRLHVGDAVVPAVLLLPPDIERKVPAALLLHGYSSRKERMADTIGRALAGRGVAALAIDLPLHGAPVTRSRRVAKPAIIFFLGRRRLRNVAKGAVTPALDLSSMRQRVRQPKPIPLLQTIRARCPVRGEARAHPRVVRPL
jgi:hypothetical protein